MSSLQTQEAWRQRVARWRHEKDSYVKRDPHSPIPTTDRDGLDYYPPEPA